MLRLGCILFIMLIAAFLKGSEVVYQSVLPWELSAAQLEALVNKQVKSIRDSKDSSASRDSVKSLIYLSAYCDGGTSELVGEGVVVYRRRFGKNAFISIVKEVPERFLGDLPQLVELAGSKELADEVKSVKGNISP